MNIPLRISLASQIGPRAWSPRLSLHNQLAKLNLENWPAHWALLQKQQRHYSVQTSEEFVPQLLPLNASNISITKTSTPKALSPPQDLKFGHVFTGDLYQRAKLDTLLMALTDHMLSVEWTASSGWLAPRITPYQNLSLDPATCVFHYGFECFEGMKAYRAADGSIRLFRPDMNMIRFNRSAARIALPTFDSEQLIELVKQLVKVDERFIPQYARSVTSFCAANCMLTYVFLVIVDSPSTSDQHLSALSVRWELALQGPLSSTSSVHQSDLIILPVSKP